MIVVVSFYPVCCVIVGILFWHTCHIIVMVWLDLNPCCKTFNFVVKVHFCVFSVRNVQTDVSESMRVDFLVLLLDVQQKQSDVIENRSKVIGVLAAQRGFCSQTN